VAKIDFFCLFAQKKFYDKN